MVIATPPRRLDGDQRRRTPPERAGEIGPVRREIIFEPIPAPPAPATPSPTDPASPQAPGTPPREPVPAGA
jgi:hypothetical protein